MSRCIEFLTELGFGEIIGNDFSLEHIAEDDFDFFGDQFEENISILREEFDDEFIVAMFVDYTPVFMRDDFSEMLSQIEKEFNTDMWGSLIQYEWNTTGESSIFDLMDVLEIGYFDSHLSEVCNKIRSIWESDYGEDEM